MSGTAAGSVAGRGLEPVRPGTVAALLARIAETAPRVQCVTNTVAQAITANLLLAVGARVSMASHPAEIDAMTRTAQAALINLGTLDPQREAAIAPMAEAVRRARLPLVLDPVFVDVSPVRRTLTLSLLDTPRLILRGNETEMASLGEELKRTPHVVKVTTGATDRIKGPAGCLIQSYGHPMMTRVTGLGCAAGALIAAFAAVEEDAVAAASAALAAFGVAGEIAAETAAGPGSFAVALIDALAGLDETNLARRMETRS